MVLAGCGGGAPEGENSQIMRWGGDLLGGGGVLSIPDSIPGDAIVAGGEIAFSGVAGGDFIGAGGQQELGGRIAGDVRAAGGELMLTGVVEKNVTAAGGRVEIGEGATIGGNAYLAGQNLRVAGEIDGFLRAAGQNVVLDGTIAGSVDVRSGSLRVGPGARIAGDLTYGVPPEDVVIDPGAQIAGQVIERPTPEGPPIGLFRALWMIGFLVAGTVVVALFPGATSAAEASLRARPAAAFGFGLLWVIVVPLCIVAIAITGVGLPLALIIAALYLISLYLGRAVLAVWMGRWLLRGRDRPGRGGVVVAFLIGAIILLLLGLVPVVGGMVMIVATVLGLGALVLAFRMRGYG
jgi:cytoskeletal protein CcmA (bactofilin family)